MEYEVFGFILNNLLITTTYLQKVTILKTLKILLFPSSIVPTFKYLTLLDLVFK